MNRVLFLAFILWCFQSHSSDRGGPKHPSYCPTSNESSAAQSPSLKPWGPSSFFRGIASQTLLEKPESAIPLQKSQMGCQVFRQEARQYAIATLIYKLKEMERLFPELQTDIPASCAQGSPKIAAYGEQLKYTPPLSDFQRQQKLKETLAILLTQNYAFQKHFPSFEQRTKDLEISDNIDFMKKEVEQSRRILQNNHAPMTCAPPEKCTPQQAIWVKRLKNLENALARAESQYEKAKKELAQLERSIYSNPILLDFKTPFLLKKRSLKPSAFSDNIFHHIHNAVQISSRHSQNLEESLENLSKESDNSLDLEMINKVFLEALNGKTPLQVGEQLLAEAYEKRRETLEKGLKNICNSTNFQVTKKLANEVIGVAPSERKKDYQDAHCDCLQFWPASTSNKAQVALGLLSAGVGYAGAYLTLPALSIGALIFGTGATGIAAYKTLQSRKNQGRTKALHQGDLALAQDVHDDGSQFAKNTYGAAVDLAILPFEFLALRKALHPEKSFLPHRKWEKGDVDSTGLLRKIGIKPKTFRLFSYAIRENQIEALNFIGSKSPRVARLLGSRIAKLCKKRQCKDEDVDHVLESATEVFAMDDLERTAYGRHLQTKLHSPSQLANTGSRPPETLLEKIRFFQDAGRIDNKPTFDILEILSPLNWNQRQRFLQMLHRLDFKKGLDLEKDPREISDWLTQLRFFGNYKPDGTIGQGIRQLTRCHDIRIKDQSRQCMVLEEQIRSALVTLGYQRIGRLHKRLKIITQQPAFQKAAAAVLNQKFMGRLLKSKGVDGNPPRIPQDTLEEMARTLSNPELSTWREKMKFASRADVKTILKEKNGWEILQILWHSSDHLLKKAGLLWLAYEIMPTTIEGLNSLHKKAKAFWTVNKIPSPEEMKQQSCGDLTRLRHQLDAMEEQGLGTTDTFFEASLRTHFYMHEKNCFSTP